MGKLGEIGIQTDPQFLVTYNLKCINLAGQVPWFDTKSYSTEHKYTSPSFFPTPHLV